MGKDWFCLFFVLFASAYCANQQEQDSSLVKLLSKGSKQVPFLQKQTLDVDDDTVEDVPINMPEKISEHQHFIPVEPNLNSILPRTTLFSDPYENAKKRERYEAGVLANPRPTNSFFDGRLLENKQLLEMQKGDVSPPELERHINQQDENLKHILEIANNANKDDTSVKPNKLLTIIRETPTDRLSKIKDVDTYYQKLGPESSEKALEDQYSSQIKTNLKGKSMPNEMPEHGSPFYLQQEVEMFKSSNPDYYISLDKKKSQKKQVRPKYKLRRIDTDRSSDDEIVNSHHLNDHDSEIVIKSSEELLQEKDENNDDQTNVTSRRHADKSSPPQVLPTVNKAFFSFSYDKESPFGPQAWHLLNVDWTCTARKQSPIDIDTKYLIDNVAVKNIVLKVNPPNSPLIGTLRNNGHAPTLSISNDVSIKLFGGNLVNDYFFKQLHFHFGCTSGTGSEHQIDGNAFPLEIHLVFWDNSTYKSFPDAAKADRGIAVLAVLFEIESPNKTTDTPLSQVIQLLRHIEEEDDTVAVKEEFNFRLENLIPNVMKSKSADRFYTYEGSLSTPGCYESVTWIVMATYLSVTESDLSVFRKLRSSKVNHYSDEMCNNYRPIQRKNGRRIYSNII
ncbi:uncharacterized protein LOC100212032 isoform X3 [Hydra vulgaris]|uniref:Carbonic anhydrase n=2 Tax=Hydra vulgaris TaxID=6087 RepID=A0ABM4D3K8_HYDVU